MPLKQPMQWCCPKCDWRDSRVQKSDVLMPRIECPKCGSDTELKPASMLDTALSQAKNFFSS